MSFTVPGSESDPRLTAEGGIHVPATAGETKWFSGDVYTLKLTTAQTAGSLGMIQASVPPGGGPPAHVHADSDETFFLLSGELEFLDGDRVFLAGPGDLVYVPRHIRHRFSNIGIVPASMLFLYTPAGPEGLFIEGGDEPRPGVQVQPWGLDRIDERMLGLLAKYDNEILPETPPA
jgi:quercetin dioxygenase-like cupin family protein